MRRALLIGAFAVAGVPGVAAAAAATTPVQPPRASLTGFTCQKSSVPLNRAVSITAVMRPVTGTAKMALKFRLLRKRPGHRAFVDISYGDLGQWKSPANPTLGQRAGDVWRDTKQVVDLSAPALYRLRVSFRWTAADGSVLGATTLTSRLCDEP